MRKHGRVDGPHKDIVAALRKAGCAVQSLAAIGGGCPDLLISKNGHCCVAEVKNGTLSPSARKLTPGQLRFHMEWKSKIFLLSSVDDAIKLANAMV